TDSEFASATESTFLREAAWVVLSSGFRESVVRRVFSGVSTAFLDWCDSASIALQIDDCRNAALKSFGNRRKIDAIADIVLRVAKEGIDRIKEKISKCGLSYLQEFPFIGPVTACHLAKNIGLPTAKPDRHLVRICRSAGYTCPNDLCRVVAEYIAEPIAVVDLVLWRFYTLTSKSPFASICSRR